MIERKDYLEVLTTTYLRRLCTYLGEDSERRELIDTPKRLGKAINFIYSGYETDPISLIAKFPKERYKEMVLLTNIEFFSTCEHHLLPFFGKCHIGYVVGDDLLGISKLARLVDCFSRRLQIQERIGGNIVEMLMDKAKVEGAGCIIESKHLCVMMRGVQKQKSIMITSSYAGSFEKTSVKSEFLSLIKLTNGGTNDYS